MKKLLLFLSVFALCTQGIDAKSITPEQAMVIAKQQMANTSKFNASNVKMTLNYAAMNLKGQTDYYVFNRDGGQGYVIVSGDDVAMPVLGYSNQGSFDYDQAPDGLKFLLEQYQYQMEWLRIHPEDALKQNRDLGYVAEMLTTRWHQEPPYNESCPRISGTPNSNGRAYTGCAANALAQIMKFWRHPETGFGENSYTHVLDGVETTFSSVFSDHTYDWTRMRNTYTGSSSETIWQKEALNTLIRDVDIALNMRYYADGSEAYYRDIVKALIAYFDYAPDIQFLMRDNYYGDWSSLILNEIDEGRPVYYFGNKTKDSQGNNVNIGHAYILDGHDQQGKVHVNWGFKIDYNGWFSLDMLSPKPASQYEYDQYAEGFNGRSGAIIGIHPDNSGMGGIVMKGGINIYADTMPNNDVRASFDVQALNGPYQGTIRYAIAAKTSEGYENYYTFTKQVDLAKDEIMTIDLSGNYPYLYDGRTYYIIIWSPYFPNNYSWNWYFTNPVSFTIGDWVTPPFILGDVNNDGSVTIADVTMLISKVLKNADYVEAGDMNGDGELTIADVTILISYVLKHGGGEE